MGWRQATFKEKQVWAEVDPAGEPVVLEGRIGIRYAKGPSAKIYRAGASRVTIQKDAPIENLESSPSPASDGQGARTASGFGSAKTRTRAQAAMAKDAAEQLIGSLEGRAVLGFTDGACKGNPGPGGSGAVLWLPNGERLESSQPLGNTTNNVAELTAIGLALNLLEKADIAPDFEVALLTDSSYAAGVLVRGWRAKANQALVQDIRTRLAKWTRLQIHWVAGHAGIEGNERADELANQGIREAKMRSGSP